MKFYRYCSREEYQKFQRGELLENLTQYRDDCQGFCFFSFKDLQEAQHTLHQLTGIVTPEMLMILETNKPLNKSQGKYAKPLPKDADFFDFFNPLLAEMKDEYCTTAYNKEDFKLLEAYEVDLNLFYEDEAKAFTKLENGTI